LHHGLIPFKYDILLTFQTIIRDSRR